MTDLTALATKLAALIAEDDVFADGGARVISQASAPPAMVAILQEIDNTVLERTLVFGLGEISVSIAAAGRRMRGIVEVSGDVAGAKDVLGQVLTRDEADILRAVGSLLHRLCDATQSVTIRSTPVRPLGNSGDAGLSASVLADVWKVDLDATPAPPMERFLSSNAGAMLGHIRVADAVIVDEKGEAAPLKAIWDNQAASFLKRHKAMQPRQDGPMLICLDGVLGSASGAAIAMMGTETCVFAYDPAQLPSIITSWSAVTR